MAKLKKQALFAVAALFAVLLAFSAAAVSGKSPDDIVFEFDDDGVKAGVTPDSSLHFFDRLFDRVGLAMAFGSEAKADRAMMVAKERLAETEKMMASNKLGAAGIAQAGHGDALEVVRHSLRRMRSDNPDASLESQIEFEAELEEHEIEINHVRDGLKLRLELKDGLSESQLSVIDSLISLLQNQTGKVKADIEGEKDRLKLKIKSSEGKSEVEFEAEIRGLEEKAGLVGLRRERAVEQIDEALEEIAEAKDMMFGRNLSNLTGGAAIAELVSQAEMKIADARAAFSDGRFGEAFGLAESAEQLAKNAKRQLERAISVSEDSSGRNGVGDERLEIKAELFNSTSEVKVELRFTAASTDRVGAISELLSRLNLTKEDINRLLDLENETEDERDFNNRLKTEIKTKEGLASVRFELEFPLNTTSRADIVDSIFSRLSSLTKDDLERALGAGERFEFERRDKREIEVEVEDGIAKVKVEVGPGRLRFSMPFTNESAVFAEISSIAGIPIAEVMSLAKVEFEDDEDEDGERDRRRGRGSDDNNTGDDDDENESRGRESDDDDDDRNKGERRGRGSGNGNDGGSGKSNGGGRGRG